MIKVMELFAGVGGFRIGLERNKNTSVVWGNQFEPSKKRQDAFDCYSKNFKDKGIHVNKDIATVTEDELKNIEIDMIVGGFPCQDYSVSNSGAKGIEGKKGVLFWEIKRMIEMKNPKYVLLENVDRLLKSPSKQSGRDFSIMLATFRDLGYDVEWRVINAAEYGQAQKRKRIFIFAYRTDLELFKQTSEYTGIQAHFKSQIHEYGFFAKSFPIQLETSQKHPSKTYFIPTDILEVSDSFTANYLNAGVMRSGYVYTSQTIPKYEQPLKLRDILEKNVDQKYYLSESAIEKIKHTKSAKKIERVAKTGFKYTFSEGAVAFPDLLDSPGRTMLTSEASVNRSTHVVEDEGGLRYITPIECERLNGFPDNWTNTGMSDRMRYFCMGNALVVDLIEKMGNRVIEIDQD